MPARLLTLGLGTLLAASLFACTATAPTSSTSATGSPGAVSFTTTIAPMITASCVSCHKAGGPGAGKVTMADASGQLDAGTISQRAGAMLREISNGTMPRGGPKWSAEQIATFTAWQQAGAPQN